MIPSCILSERRQLSFQKQSEKMQSVAYFKVGRFAGGLERRSRRRKASGMLSGTCSEHFGECVPLL